MELNEQIKKALETKDVKTVVTALYDSRCGDTYGDNIFEMIVEGYYCGCGSYSDEDTELIKKVFYYAAENRTEKFKDVIFNEYFGDEDRMAEMMMNILDSVGLVEHGSTMRYPWLTDIGEALYAGLKDLERIEAEYKKENDWYDGVCGFDFGLIDNPYEEKKEKDNFVPEAVKAMLKRDSIYNDQTFLTGSGNSVVIMGNYPLSLPYEDPTGLYWDEEKQEWYRIERAGFIGEGIVFGEGDEKPSDGLNRAQRRKRNKGKKD